MKNYKKIIAGTVLSSVLLLSPNLATAALTVGSDSVTTDSTLSLQGGNVGIGTLSPDQELDVEGNIAIPTTVDATTGVIYKGADRFIHNFALAGTHGVNTFVGIGAGNFTMTGSVGSQGSYNTVMGYVAGASNTTGSFNSMFGSYSMYQNQSGSYNMAFGHNALLNNTSGSYNIGVGYRSLFSNTTGSYNIAIGHQALFDQSILDGTGANTAIGYNTGRGITTGVNNTIIGANVTGLGATLSNNIIIADGAGNQRINVDSAGEVGIGTNDPSGQLHINGSSDENYIKVTNTASSLNGFYFGLEQTTATLWNSEDGDMSFATDDTLQMTLNTTGDLSIVGDTINIATPKTPASAGAACAQGDIVWDTNFVYVCVANNTWKRSAIATW